MNRLTILLCFLFVIISSSFSQEIYWLNKADNLIYSKKLSTTNGANAITSATSFSSVTSFAVNDYSDSLFVSGIKSGQHKIFKFGETTPYVIKEINSVYKPVDIVVASANKKLYWTESQDNRVYSSSLSGKSIAPLTNTLGDLGAIGYESKNDNLYFVDVENGITYKMGADGSGIKQILTVYKPVAFAFHQKSELIYFANANDNKVYTCDFDGKNINPVAGTYVGISDVKIDENNQLLFVADKTDKKLYKMSFNGSNSEVVYNGHEFSNLHVKQFEISLKLTDVGSGTYSAGSYFYVTIEADKDFDIANKFIAEMSDVNGDFSSPTELGVFESNKAVAFEVRIPTEAAQGTTYKVRVRSTAPVSVSNLSNKIEVGKNKPPYFLTTAPTEAYQDSMYTYFVQGEDGNGDLLTYTAVEKPEWLKFHVKEKEGVLAFAGTNISGNKDGLGNNARFNSPKGIAIDKDRNLYVADYGNHCIRKISPEGSVTTLAGTGQQGYVDGEASIARFYFPTGLAVDDSGNVYVADSYNHCIRKISTDGQVTTIAGNGSSGFENGKGTKARFFKPYDLVIWHDGNLYVTDAGNNQIRKIDENYIVSTFSGAQFAGHVDGSRITSRYKGPMGISVYDENYLVVADNENHAIRKIDANGNATTIAGTTEYGYVDGLALQAEFRNPTSVGVDVFKNVYVADNYNHVIRKVDKLGNVSTFCGEGSTGFFDGKLKEAKFKFPQGIVVDDSVQIFVVDNGNHAIRLLQQPTYKLYGVPAKDDVGDNNVLLNLTDQIAEDKQSFKIRVNGKAPTEPATNLQFEDVQPTSMTLKWTNGNGSFRIVVAKEDTDVDFVPEDEVVLNGINSDFRLANGVNGENKIVYQGDGNFCNVTGLTPQKKYYFVVYEFNGEADFSKYLTASVVKGSYSTFDLYISNVLEKEYFVSKHISSPITIPFETRGDFGQNNVFSVYLSDVEGKFGNAVYIGGVGSKESGVIEATIPAGSFTSDKYKLQIVSSEPEITAVYEKTINIVSHVTVDITSDEEDPTGTVPFDVVVEFSENVSGFESSQLRVSNANIVDTHILAKDRKWRLSIEPLAEGKITLQVPQGVAKNVRNTYNDESNLFSITYDDSFPTVNLTSSENDFTNKSSFKLTITFSEKVVGFDITDISYLNCKIQNFAVLKEQKIWTVDVVPTGENVEVSIMEGAAKDTGDNLSVASNEFAVVFDNIAPTVMVTAPNGENTNQKPIIIEVEFWEKVSGFNPGELDIKQAVVKEVKILEEDKKWQFSLTPYGDEITLTVPENVAYDKAGNNNKASAPFTVYFDEERPTVSITSDEPNPTNQTIFAATVEFNEKIQELTLDDFQLTDCNISSITPLVENKKYMIAVEPTGKNVMVAIPENKVFDLAGNANKVSNIFKRAFDNDRPTVSLSSNIENPVLTNSIDLSIVFSKEVTGFEKNNIILPKGEITKFIELVENKEWKVTISLKEGSTEIYIPEGAAQDDAGNYSLVSNVINIEADFTLPKGTFSSSHEDGVTSDKRVGVSLKFSEEVDGFSKSNINISGGVIEYMLIIEPNKEYYVETIVTGTTLNLTIPENTFKDMAGNYNSEEVLFSIQYDDVKPTVTIQNVQPNPLGDPKFSVMVEFSEPIIGFNAKKLEFENCSNPNVFELVEQTKFRVDFLATGNPITIWLEEKSVKDLAGNFNEKSKVLTLNLDNEKPSVDIVYGGTGSQKDYFYVKVTLSEEMQDIDQSAFNITNATVVGLTKETKLNYILEFIPEANSDVIVFLPEGAAKDVAGNGNIESRKLMISFGDDIIAPEASVSSTVTEITNKEFTVTFSFNEEVTQFTKSDVSTTNADILDVYTSDNKNFSVLIDPIVEGQVEVYLEKGVVLDLAYNGNVATEVFSILYNNTGPTAIWFVNPNKSINENAPMGTVVGKFRTDDPTPNDAFTYELVNGNGTNDKDNSKFIIVGNELVLNGEINYEESTESRSISVFVKSTDIEGQSFKRGFIIPVKDINEAPVLKREIDDYKMHAKQMLDYKLPLGTFTDEDHAETLEYSADLINGTMLPEWLFFDGANRYFYGKPEVADTLVLKVTVKDKGGLTASTTFKLMIDFPVGIDEKVRNSTKIYPNPANNNVNIKIPAIKNQFVISIVDMYGKTLKSINTNSIDNVVSLQGIAPGVYFVRIFSDGESYNQKLIVE